MNDQINYNQLMLFPMPFVGILMIDQQAIISFVDQVMADFLGFDPAEMTGKSFFYFLPAPLNDEFKIKLEGSGLTNNHRDALKFLRKDGTTMEAHIVADPIYDSSKKYTGTLFRVTDIEREKRWENEKKLCQKIGETKEKLQSIWEAIGDAIYILDTDYNILEANSAASKIQGAKPEEIIGEKCFSFYLNRITPCPDNCPVVKVIKTGKPAFTRCPVKRKSDGAKIWMDKHVLPLYDSQGQVDRIIIYARDVTDMKEIEDKLRKSEELYRLILETNIDGIDFLNRDGIIQYVNKSFCSVRGYSKEEVIGKHFSEFVLPQEKEAYIQKVEMAFQNPKPDATEFREVAKNGSILIMELAWDFVFQEGKPIAAVVVSRNISEKKELQQKLIHSEKLSAVGQLAAGISHEFNNILAIILGTAQVELLSYNDFGDNGSSYGPFKVRQLIEAMQIIEGQAMRGRKLVQNMNAFAQQSEPLKERCQVSEIIEEVLELQDKQLFFENISVIKKYEIVPDLYLDKSQFQQVFLNIIINARHALLPKRGGEISLSIKSKDDWVEISIQDTGIGVDKDGMKKLFTPFYTTKAPLGKDKIPGTGLGLSVSYGIIKNHGGEISCNSEKGIGTTFTIRLPSVNREEL